MQIDKQFSNNETVLNLKGSHTEDPNVLQKTPQWERLRYKKVTGSRLMQSFIQTVKVMGQELLISQENYWLILQYVYIHYILVLCLLCYTLGKALFIGLLLDGQVL